MPACWIFGTAIQNCTFLDQKSLQVYIKAQNKRLQQHVIERNLQLLAVFRVYSMTHETTTQDYSQHQSQLVTDNHTQLKQKYLGKYMMLSLLQMSRSVSPYTSGPCGSTMLLDN